MELTEVDGEEAEKALRELMDSEFCEDVAFGYVDERGSGKLLYIDSTSSVETRMALAVSVRRKMREQKLFFGTFAEDSWYAYSIDGSYDRNSTIRLVFTSNYTTPPTKVYDMPKEHFIAFVIYGYIESSINDGDDYFDVCSLPLAEALSGSLLP